MPRKCNGAAKHLQPRCHHAEKYAGGPSGDRNNSLVRSFGDPTVWHPRKIGLGEGETRSIRRVVGGDLFRSELA